MLGKMKQRISVILSSIEQAGFYMKNKPLAPIHEAQIAIKVVAINTGMIASHSTKMRRHR